MLIKFTFTYIIGCMSPRSETERIKRQATVVKLSVLEKTLHAATKAADKAVRRMAPKAAYHREGWQKVAYELQENVTAEVIPVLGKK